jgi:sulfate-transporting ATPase
MAGTVPGALPGHRGGITHDRYFLDNAAEWILELDRGHGIPWKGNYSSWLEQKQDRLKQEEATESARQKALQKNWNGRARTQGAPGQVQSPSGPLQELQRIRIPEAQRNQEIFIPWPSAWAMKSSSSRTSPKLRRPPADRQPVVHDSAGAIVGIIGPNGAGKSTLFKMITGRNSRTAAKS